jgi:hypothetical protein
MQGVPVVAIGRLETAEAIQGVMMQSETMRADATITDVIATDVAAANAATGASHVFAGTHAADMGGTAKTFVAEASAAKTSDVTSAAAHMAAATEAAAKPSAVTATTTATACVGCARQQARSEKSCGQYRDHPFHHDTPFSSGCSAP